MSTLTSAARLEFACCLRCAVIFVITHFARRIAGYGTFSGRVFRFDIHLIDR